mmetsp:Transcript_23331/g.32978  ORF Transcript_23331/g.32978 Transcript_23331/m.32978 type:complete len:286 (-) Transcript_23331:292-1149(-)|eukprot:CAMPEP_0175096282 /NCGR_PEP_ID=MMETSP0086_2-20121207/4642_1 /TAXON_ID=136419 /ORGANISM="Unknown Unknown, Strain D1" /LENGTH=285 /DNA_ID=CAMNT_0016369659 /DNA_START=3 /DNA_END=860 /DNA_ORIENTATION=-
MSVKTTIPGYSGHIPNFQQEFPSTKPTPAYKYEDVDIPERTLMDNSNYISTYTQTHGERAIIHKSRRQRNGESQKKSNLELAAVQKIAENDANRQMTINIRHAYEYEARPTYWSTSYNTNFDGWKASTIAKETYTKPNNINFVQDSQGAHNLLTGPEQLSSYQRSFGRFGHDPKTHYFPEDGKRVFSRRATDRDLFFGTSKNTVRIPGYGGFVPESKNNIDTIRQNVPYDTKDNMLMVYRHNMPGYTGHNPTAVINDRGPRNPISKKPPPEGLQGSLTLETMKLG